jgi:hypothetical protein
MDGGNSFYLDFIERKKRLWNENRIYFLDLFAKECYSMKLDLLTNATVVDDAIRFVSQKSKCKDQLEEEIKGITTKSSLLTH